MFERGVGVEIRLNEPLISVGMVDRERESVMCVGGGGKRWL